MNWWRKIRARSLSHLPGPRGLAFLKLMLHFLRDSLGALEVSYARYGPVVSYPWPISTVILYAPKDIAHVLADKRRIYVKGAQTDELKAVMGEGLVTNNDRESWSRHRASVTHVMSAQAVRGFAPIFAELTDVMLARWSSGAVLDVATEMRRLTFAIAGRTLLGADLTDREAEVVDAAVLFTSRVVHEHMFSVVPVPYWVPTAKHRAFHRHRRALDGVVQRLIALARSSSPAEIRETSADRTFHDTRAGQRSVLERLVHSGALDDRALRDEILTLLIAGYETTSNTLAWVLGAIAAHPEVQRRVQQEVDTQGAISSTDFRETHPFTRLTMLEAMRLYTAIPMSSRRALADDTIAGHHLPASTSVVVPTWVLHRDPEFWKEPLAFSPARFEGCPAHRLEHYVPFSKGERGCPGQTFAMVEIAVIVTRLLARFSVELVEPTLPRAVSEVSLKPEGGLPLRLVARA
jgi:cytochrome P450